MRKQAKRAKQPSSVSARRSVRPGAAQHRHGAPSRRGHGASRRPRPHGSRAVPPVRLVLLALLAVVLLAGLYNAYRARPIAEEPPYHLVLNEVGTDDQRVLTAPDGYYHSWVELYNPTDQAVPLDGWSLSNKKTDLRRYAFPEGLSVEPGGRLLVWCTGSLGDDPSAAVKNSGVPYASFTVMRGDDMCLSRSGYVMDHLAIPGDLPRGSAYGRVEDGGLECSALDATPEAANNSSALHKSVAQPVLSVPSGFYDEPFQLSISAPEGCTVYYTVDCSRPTADSTPYTEPIQVEDATPQANVFSQIQTQGFYTNTPLYEGQQPIYDHYYGNYLTPTENLDKCTVVRAVAVDTEGNVSDPVTASYFVGFDGRSAYENVSVMSLVSDPDDLFGDLGILVAGKEYEDKLADGTITTKTYWGSVRRYTNFFRKGSAWERAAHLDFFNEDKSLSFSQETGIRCHGNASRKRVPKAFSLYAREKYDGSALFEQPLFDTQTLTDKVFLVNGAAVRRYALVKRMDSRGMDTQDYRLVQLFLDGEYWGFYAVQEAYNSGTYLNEHYGLDNDGTILLKSNSRELVPVYGTKADIEEHYNPLMDYVASHDMTKEENWTELNTMMDVQSFIDVYAANLYLCNMDFNWHHNIYLFQTRKVRSGNPWADGRWHWMLYDVDYSTGDNKNVPVEHNMFQGKFLNSKHGLSLDPIFPYLAKNEHFRAMFVNTYMDLANDVYGVEEMRAVTDQLKEQWKEAVYASVLRNPLSDDAATLNRETHDSRFGVNCDNLAEFFRQRFGYAVPYMADYFHLTGQQVTVTLQSSDGGSVGLNTLTPDLSSGSWSGVYYTDVPVQLSAHPEPGMRLDHWEVSSGKLEQAEDGSASLRLDGDVTVSAVFVPDEGQAEEASS